LPCLAAAYRSNPGFDHSRLTFAVALSWYGPETLLALLNRWHFSWRMPLLFILRNLMLPIVYIDAWCNHFVWRGNEMTLSAEEPSVEQGQSMRVQSLDRQAPGSRNQLTIG
jgi:ceramide glucosyltransferase